MELSNLNIKNGLCISLGSNIDSKFGTPINSLIESKFRIEKIISNLITLNHPNNLEKDIFNAIEKYSLNSDGTISTEFSFNKGSFEGERKVYNPRGFIKDKNTNALWGMQFIWPIKADFRVVYLSNDHSYTIIGRNKRDYVWLMSRTPSMSESDYSDAIAFIKEIGYDVNKIAVVPQEWPE